MILRAILYACFMPFMPRLIQLFFEKNKKAYKVALSTFLFFTIAMNHLLATSISQVLVLKCWCMVSRAGNNNHNTIGDFGCSG